MATEAASAALDHDLALSLRLPDREARRRGSVVHAMFELIEWLDDGEPDEMALAQLARRHAGRDGETWAGERIAECKRMLRYSAIRQALSRPAATVGVTQRLHRERRFVRFVDGRLQRGAIDRLITSHDADGRIVAAHVIDFKTDDADAAHCDEAARHYAPQMKAYREAVAEMHALEPASVRVTLLFTAAGAAIDL